MYSILKIERSYGRPILLTKNQRNAATQAAAKPGNKTDRKLNCSVLYSNTFCYS